MRYQYKSVSINGLFLSKKTMNDNVQKTLDYYSKEGWELVNFVSWDLGSKLIIVFKKEA